MSLAAGLARRVRRKAQARRRQQQAEGEAAAPGPPAVGPPAAARRLLARHDQKRRMRVAFGSPLRRQVVGRGEPLMVLGRGHEGRSQDSIEVDHATRRKVKGNSRGARSANAFGRERQGDKPGLPILPRRVGHWQSVLTPPARLVIQVASSWDISGWKGIWGIFGLGFRISSGVGPLPPSAFHRVPACGWPSAFERGSGVNFRGFPYVLLALTGILAATPAWGQRVQFPTMVSAADPPAASAGGASPGWTAAPAWPATPYGSTIYTQGPPFAPGPAPGAAVTPAPTATMPLANPAVPSAPPTYAPSMGPSPGLTPGTISYGPPAAGGAWTAAPPPGAAPFGPAPPVATLNGTIQPPPTGWDPYAAPGGGAPTLFAQDPYLAPGQFQLAPMFGQWYRLIRDVSFDYHWFSGHGSSGNNQLGINDVELAASINLPLPITPQAPLTVTPGFAFHFWDGPHSTPTDPAEMPPQTFDAYLDFAWNPAHDRRAGLRAGRAGRRLLRLPQAQRRQFPREGQGPWRSCPTRRRSRSRRACGI